MKNKTYKSIFKNKTSKFYNEGYQRKFLPIDRARETFPIIDSNSKKIKIWCTNDYLNMSHNQDVINESMKILEKVGTGSGGTRNISGNSPYHENLEKKIASFHNLEKAIIFSSAYTANQTSLWTLCKALDNVCVFSDKLNHASLIQGIKNSGAQCKIFDHNNLEHLEMLLKETDKEIPKLIVFESLYSMNGTIVEVNKYVELAKKYNAMTYLDEVHAVGLYGDKGSGLANFYKVNDQIDLINGTFAKGFGQIGGYVVGKSYLIDYLKTFAPGFIFTTSMMPSTAGAISKSISIVELENEKRKYIQEMSNYLKNLLRINKIPFIENNSHIIPIMIYDAMLVKKYSKILLNKYGLYIQPVFYPTVEKNKARLRLTITPKHNIEDIHELIYALKEIISPKDNLISIRKQFDYSI